MAAPHGGTSAPASSADSQPASSGIRTSSSNDTSEPSLKRRRTPLACSACRTRKSRCDGIRPACSLCQELGFECVYLQSALSQNTIVGRDYIGSLENRLLLVEDAIRLLKADNNQLFRRCGSDHGRSINTSLGPSMRIMEDSIPIEDAQHVSVRGEDEQDLAAPDDATDGMGALVFTDEEDYGFFGPSSNIAFIRHLSGAVARTLNPEEVSSAQPNLGFQLVGSMMSVSRASSPTLENQRRLGGKKDVNIYALPPEAETLRLIRQYFSDTGLLFPYLFEDTFLETYGQMKRNNFTKVRRVWLGLLNMIFAMTTSTFFKGDVTSEKRTSDSDVYYQRALGLCSKQLMRGTSLEIVQVLLLMGQYLQGTQKSVQAWTSHGLAVKAAFQLGLHSSEASTRFRAQEREIRKRTWFGCVVLDRTLSMTFGRPAEIPDYYVKLDLPCGFEGGPSSPLSQASLVFYNATITLYRILWNIIDTLYDQNIACSKPMDAMETIARIFKIEHEVGQWERDLPPILQLRKGIVTSPTTPMGDQDLHIRKFSTILTLRYLNLRILLHRPVLVIFLDNCNTPNVDTQNPMLLQQVAGNMISMCIQSSMDIIAIVHEALCVHEPQYKLLGAWWFSLYYTFNAAIVLFGTLLICRKGGFEFLKEPDALLQARQCLGNALKALQRLDDGNRTVKRCSRYLERLIVLWDSLSMDQYPSSVTDAQGLISFMPGFPQDHVVPSNVMDVLDQSPLGMELGQFMTESELDFISRNFAPSGLNSAGPVVET